MAVKFLSEIIQTIRDRGDFRNPIKFSDAIITKEAQAAFAELYQMIGKTNEGYFDTYATATTRASIPFVALPSDNWIVRAIDIIDSAGCATALRQVGIDQRNRYGVTAGKPCEYRLTSRGADLYPTPDQAYTLRILYTPSAPVLSVPTLVGSSAATFDDVTATVSTPDGVVAGDTMLIFVVGGTVDVLPDGWHDVLDLTSANVITMEVLRRTADGTESTTYDVVVDGSCAVVMLVYRNIDPTADIVDSAIVDVSGSRTFPCPTLTLESTTDLYIGITTTTDGDSATFANPFATIERIDATITAGSDHGISVFDLQPGAIGSTGTNTSIASTARDGVAASIAMKVNPFRDFVNGWEEYIVYGALVRLSGEEEVRRIDWLEQLGAARAMATSGATGRRSAEPQLIPLLDDGW